MFSRQFSWTTVYFGPTGGQQEPWCAVGRFRWKRVFTWAGKVKLSFYLLLWICFHALRRLLYDLKSAISIVCLSQVEAIKKISEYVAQLRRVGQGHGRNQNKISFLINVTNLTFSPLLNMIINYLNCLLSSPSKRVVMVGNFRCLALWSNAAPWRGSCRMMVDTSCLSPDYPY